MKLLRSNFYIIAMLRVRMREINQPWKKKFWRRRSHKWRGIFSLWLHCIAENQPPVQSEQKISRRVSLTLPQPWHGNVFRFFSACLFWCCCGLDIHNIQQKPVGMIKLTIGTQPREGEGNHCIWQDSQTFFGGKESTRFATDINDKHLSFDKKIPTLKSGKTKLCWLVCMFQNCVKGPEKEKSLSGATI